MKNFTYTIIFRRRVLYREKREYFYVCRRDFSVKFFSRKLNSKHLTGTVNMYAVKTENQKRLDFGTYVYTSNKRPVDNVKFHEK